MKNRFYVLISLLIVRTIPQDLPRFTCNTIKFKFLKFGINFYFQSPEDELFNFSDTMVIKIIFYLSLLTTLNNVGSTTSGYISQPFCVLNLYVYRINFNLFIRIPY